MADFLIPSALDLKAVEQDLLPRLVAQRPIFDFFPMENDDDYLLSWEQKDNYIGLQQLRGLNGAPPNVKRTGSKRYIATPGVYGEFALIDESELTRRRQFGTLDQLINVSDLVADVQMDLLQRRLDRVEMIGWTLMATGTFSIATFTGVTAHTDTYSIQTFSASVSWGTSATATPLADLRSVKLLARGHSVQFDASAKMYMNSTTANKLYSNTNNADLYGRRTAGLGTFNSPGQINQLFTGDNLPQIVEYDMGYIDDTNTFQLYIPTNKVIVVGTRPNNQPVGAYRFTRNANNAGLAAGPYTKVVDRGENDVPRSIEVHDGHTGGPVVYYPSAVVVMSV